MYRKYWFHFIVKKTTYFLVFLKLFFSYVPPKLLQKNILHKICRFYNVTKQQFFFIQDFTLQDMYPGDKMNRVRNFQEQKVLSTYYKFIPYKLMYCFIGVKQQDINLTSKTQTYLAQGFQYVFKTYIFVCAVRVRHNNQGQ